MADLEARFRQGLWVAVDLSSMPSVETDTREPSKLWRAAGAAMVALATALSAGPAAAKAFDLDCEGARYRIDLTRKLWCEDTCGAVRRVFAVDRRVVTLSLFDHFSTKYDRRKREMINGFAALGMEDDSRSACRVLRFSGFPAAAEFPDPAT